MRVFVVGAIVFLVLACKNIPSPHPVPFVERCPEYPTYKCLVYCIVFYPEGDAATSEAPGWCNDPRLPDYGEFCCQNTDVFCKWYCEDHPEKCEKCFLVAG